MRDTEEQMLIIDECPLQQVSAIKSIAGAGKTYITSGVVRRLKKSIGTQGHVFYFGAANAKEGRAKMRVPCSTFHAAAVRDNGHMMHRRGRLLWHRVAGKLKISNDKAYLVQKALISYCKSWRDEVSEKDVRISNKTDQKEIIELTQDYFSEMTRRNSNSTIDFSIILKKWALSKPDLGLDFMIVDEFQDTSDVNIGLIRSQIDRGALFIGVGDERQAIMQFTGAMKAFEKIDFDREFGLTQSFRNGQAIVDLSADFLNKYTNKNHEFKGLDNNAKITNIDTPHAFIARTNYTIIDRLLDEISSNGKPYVVGGADNLLSIVYGCKSLMSGGKATASDLSNFKSWRELIDYIDSDIGGDLKPLVSAVNRYGVDYLVKEISKVKNQSITDASIVLSTATRSKGLEFNSVKLAGDFKLDLSNGDDKPSGLTEASLNLVYVALTRSLGDIDVGAVSFPLHS